MNRVPNVDRYKLAGDESGRLGVDGTQSGDETSTSAEFVWADSQPSVKKMSRSNANPVRRCRTGGKSGRSDAMIHVGDPT